MILVAPKAMTFTSACVDVIQMESPPWIEQFWVITRPCGADCYVHMHCPHWQRAVLCLGEWALTAEPEWVRTCDNGGEEYLVSRTLVPAADSEPAPHDHWAWEYTNLDDLVIRACNFLQMGLDLGHQVMVVAHADTIQLMRARPDFSGCSDDVRWWDVHDALRSARPNRGPITVGTVRDSAVVRELISASASSRVWIFTEHLGWHDSWESAMASETVINELVEQYDIAVACAVPDLSHELGGAYPRLCEAHARMVVV